MKPVLIATVFGLVSFSCRLKNQHDSMIYDVRLSNEGLYKRFVIYSTGPEATGKPQAHLRTCLADINNEAFNRNCPTNREEILMDLESYSLALAADGVQRETVSRVISSMLQNGSMQVTEVDFSLFTSLVKVFENNEEALRNAEAARIRRQQEEFERTRPYTCEGRCYYYCTGPDGSFSDDAAKSGFGSGEVAAREDLASLCRSRESFPDRCTARLESVSCRPV